MKTFVLYILAFIFCIIGFIFLDYAFPELDTRKSIALGFGIICFYWYQRIFDYIGNKKD